MSRSNRASRHVVVIQSRLSSSAASTRLILASALVVIVCSSLPIVFSSLAGAATPTYDQPEVLLPFTGLYGPSGIAVDSHEDLFVADTFNNRVVELPSGSTSQEVLPFTGLNQPWGVAVDKTGDVFVSQDGEILELVASVTKLYASISPGLTQGLAIDSSGNLFVSLASENEVIEIHVGSRMQTVLPFTGLSNPWGVAVDAKGDVFVGDVLNARVLELPVGSNRQVVVATNLNDGPGPLAVDVAGWPSPRQPDTWLCGQ